MSQVKTIDTMDRGFHPKPINVAKVAWKSLNWKKIVKQSRLKCESSRIKDKGARMKA